MNIALDGDFYQMGWAACYLGLPCRHPSSAPKDDDLQAFADGYLACHGMTLAARQMAYDEFRRQGRLRAFWVDDDNNEVNPATGRRV
jgi:hypothetical protein